MRIYLAGPLFTRPERDFNSQLDISLRIRGCETWLPQDAEPRQAGPKAIFEMDRDGIVWADCVVACMDGSDPDSGTAWECGYAYGLGKPILLYRTDFRNGGDDTQVGYNLMLVGSATHLLNTVGMTAPEIASMIVETLNEI